MTACCLKDPRQHKERASESSESGYDSKLYVDHAGNKLAFMWLSPLVLESAPSCYQGDCSKCANNSVVFHDGVSDNLRNFFMFLAFKKFHNLNIDKMTKFLY